MNINKNSWHYKFIDWMGHTPHRRTDVCSYTRGLLHSIFIFSVSVVGISLAIGIVGFSLIIGFFANDLGGVIISTFAWIFVGTLAIVIIREEELDNSPIVFERKDKATKQPSLLSVWWKGFKEKTCYKVDFYE